MKQTKENIFNIFVGIDTNRRSGSMFPDTQNPKSQNSEPFLLRTSEVCLWSNQIKAKPLWKRMVYAFDISTHEAEVGGSL